jgi:hypothetical protein
MKILILIMIGHFFVFVALAFQQKKADVPAESAEHKFLVAKLVKIVQAKVDAITAKIDCTDKAKDGKDVDDCARIYKPLMSEIDKEYDLINAQIEKVDECSKVYRSTIDKKQSDLTVRESQAVKACIVLDLYPFVIPPGAKY